MHEGEGESGPEDGAAYREIRMWEARQAPNGTDLVRTVAYPERPLPPGGPDGVPVKDPEKAQEVKLSAPLGSPTAGMRLLKDGSIAAVNSGLLTGKPAQIQRVEPHDGWKKATVKVTDTVEDPVTSDVTAGPNGMTYALSGGLADLFAGKPHDGFNLTPVKTD
ncbi:hypothetical protein [Streptomyces sp. NEAU-174]|uniref:hypothetical protein n=1 Tax=Streptomyces sp. NEAU-174 TaxID=3458254 RepID=UPI004044E4C8